MAHQAQRSFYCLFGSIPQRIGTIPIHAYQAYHASHACFMQNVGQQAGSVRMDGRENRRTHRSHAP